MKFQTPALPDPSQFTNQLQEWASRTRRAIMEGFSSLQAILNQGINVQDNTSFVIKSVTAPATANTEFSVAVNMNQIPVMLSQFVTSGAVGQLYQSTTAWTKTTIYLKSTTASTVYSIEVK